jgi:5-oxoprolinase (ATP-hydrolysing) subunit A
MFPDLNCDMGEGIAGEETLMPLITSANIACGFHAGSGDMIRKTIGLALQHGVHIGAHPSFRDRANFGRREMHLNNDKVYALMLEQLIKIDLIAKEQGVRLHHVKPHGALYNMAARDAVLARTVVTAIKDFDEDLVLYGLSGSQLIREGEAIGLKTANEVFADRRYNDDGSLVSRSLPEALIEDVEHGLQQVKQFVISASVTTVSGELLPIVADTICIHGDGPHAFELAQAISNYFRLELAAAH